MAHVHPARSRREEVGAQKNKITIIIAAEMVSHMPGAAAAKHTCDFEFRVIVILPCKMLSLCIGMKQPEGTAVIRMYYFKFDFQWH